jgi:riboflavin transporter FmnP|tara:strand:- start:14468 stop:14830 length:363 start_codon:yes stop_codon:yes gene_type:complete
MTYMNEPSPKDQALLSAMFARMDVLGMSIAVGVLTGLALFLATAILLLQDVPAGYPIGPHLNVLSDYLPGYSVSWAGSVAGLLDGFVLGAIAGFVVALLWNLTRYIALASMLIKTAVLAD